MNRTEPSARAKFAPPGWFDLNPQVTDQFHRQWFGSPDGLLVASQELHDEPQLAGGGAQAPDVSRFSRRQLAPRYRDAFLALLGEQDSN